MESPALTLSPGIDLRPGRFAIGAFAANIQNLYYRGSKAIQYPFISLLYNYFFKFWISNWVKLWNFVSDCFIVSFPGIQVSLCFSLTLTPTPLHAPIFLSSLDIIQGDPHLLYDACLYNFLPPQSHKSVLSGLGTSPWQ